MPSSSAISTLVRPIDARSATCACLEVNLPGFALVAPDPASGASQLRTGGARYQPRSPGLRKLDRRRERTPCRREVALSVQEAPLPREQLRAIEGDRQTFYLSKCLCRTRSWRSRSPRSPRRATPYPPARTPSAIGTACRPCRDRAIRQSSPGLRTFRLRGSRPTQVPTTV